MNDLGSDVEQNIFVIKFTIWVVASLLVVAGLRLLVLSTSLETQFIKQRITAWVANIRQAMFFVATQAFCFNIAMALRVIVEARNVEPIFHYVQHFFLLAFEVMLLAALIALSNILKGGGPSPFSEYREVSQQIDGLEYIEEQQARENHEQQEVRQ